MTSQWFKSFERILANLRLVGHARARRLKTMRALMAAAGLGGLLLAPGLVSARVPYAKNQSTKSAANVPARSPSATSPMATTATDALDGQGGVCAVPGKAADDRKLGTAITWAETPDAAARAAFADKKLVFMIQVSGNFARQEFT